MEVLLRGSLLIYSGHVPSLPSKHVRFLSHTWRKERQLFVKLTLSRLAVLGSMTLRISRTSCAIDDPTCPCLMTKDLGTPSALPGLDATPPFRCVLFFRLLAMYESEEDRK